MEEIIAYNVFEKSQYSNSKDVNIIKEMLVNAVENLLTKKQRQCIKMHYFEGMPMNQIARELGVCPSTVTRNTSRQRSDFQF